MLSARDKILVALSGGSDSVAMLLLLLEYKRVHADLDLTIEALHFNHMIRGNDANDDEAYCKKLCDDLGVRITISSGDVPAVSKATGKSLEEAARDLRYAALRKRAAEMGEQTKIAVAHNLSDNAETVFLNIVRGTSIDGLKGIRYVYKDLIRPLRDITKEETYEILSNQGIEYRTDKTNFEADATRNKIRLELFPKIDELLGCDIKEKLNSLSQFADIDAMYIEKEAIKAYGKIKKGNSVDIPTLWSFFPSIQSRLVRLFIADATVNGEKPFNEKVSITKTMVSRVLDFSEKGTNGARIELGKGLYVKRQGNSLIFSDFMDASIPEEYNLCAEEFSGAELENALKIARASKDCIVAFDKDKLFELTDGNAPTLRKPLPGDMFATVGGSGKKQLRRFLTDVKIPLEERKNVNVLAYGNNILHIFEIRRSKYATIQKDTKCAIIYRLVTQKKD